MEGQHDLCLLGDLFSFAKFAAIYQLLDGNIMKGQNAIHFCFVLYDSIQKLFLFVENIL